MFRKIALSFLLAITLLTSACGPLATLPPTAVPTLAPIAITDGLGRKIHLSTPAQRIVSLAPSNTEILFAIGAGAQVVGRDQFSDYPPAAQKTTNIGDTSNKLNTELILSLKPDLVLAAGITPPEQVKALEDLGITVFVVPNPTDLDGMYANLRLVASLTGHATESETLVTSLKDRVDAVQKKITGVSQKPLVFYELDSTDANAPWTSGPGTFIDKLIGMAGGRNVGSILQGDWAQISVEELVRQEPDMILLGDANYGGVTPDLVKQRAAWKAMTAVKNDRIFPFDDNTVSRPGPRLVDGLEALAKRLHPELFQ